MHRSRVLGLLLATVLISGCGPVATSTDLCPDSTDWATTICPKAIAAANERLGWLHWPITSTQVRSRLCGPAMRCGLALEPTDAWVIFTFSVGEPVMIHVGPPDPANAQPGVLLANEPEAPPDWILEELARAR